MNKSKGKEGLVCRYARFHHPVPAEENKEPVHEFRTQTVQVKYKVDSMLYTQNGLVCTIGEEEMIIPLANVVYVRTIKY